LNSRDWKDLGNTQRAAGRLAEAAQSYRRSIEIAPDYADSLYNLGLVLRELGQLEEAERCFRRAAEIDPRDAETLAHLATLLHEARRFEEAGQAYRLALEIAPGNAYLWLRLGSLSCQTGHTAEADRCYGEALERDPDLAAAPEFAAAQNDLGCALFGVERLDEAAECFARAVQLQPGYADAHFNFGVVHSLRGDNERALACAETALRLQPGNPTFAAKVLTEVQNLCQWPRLDELYGLLRRNAQRAEQRPFNPFCMLSIPSTAAEQLRCAVKFSDMHAHDVADDRRRLNFNFNREPRSRLRIGYLSADFHRHATAYLAAELFELHDRSRFEVIAYSYGPEEGSEVRARLKSGFDRFVDVQSLSHAEAAAAIHADGVEILVDLKGYTVHARPQIMALQPAPLQVSYLGYPGTMGADFIDYLVSDRFISPVERAGDFSEKLVLMPDSYQVNDRRRKIARTPSRQALGLPGDGFVFCCFNQAYKILPEVFSAWMRMLQAIPGSVLWLLDLNPQATQNLRHEASGRGVDPSRLIFAPVLPLAEHLGRLAAADLFLDTLPVNAHTTASDALWAGLPLLTCAGESFASRVAGSLLAAVGMPELVTRTLAEYEALGLRLARAPVELAGLRNKLSRNRDAAPLFDTPRFVRNLESAFEVMWGIHRSGGAPRLIEL
jgi:predicted O-linked N-acetylglucosamine transferase (SPINDLY family)